MKRIFSVFLALVIAFSAFPIYASNNYEKAWARIEPFELIEEKAYDEPVTRGESVRALIKMLVKAELPNDGSVSPFKDVAKESKYAPYINYAYALSYLSGVDAENFAPESLITAEQFIKVSVSALGYKMQAEREGGYPDGYMALAAKLKLLDGVSFTKDSFTFEAAVKILDNMMDARTLEESYSSDEYQLSSETLYVQMLEKGNLKVVKGIVTAVGKAYLDGYSGAKTGEISIDGMRMKYECEDISILGKRVIASVNEDDKEALPSAVSIYEEKANEDITVEAKDLTKLDKDEAVWYDEEEEATSVIYFEDLSVIYNERILTDHLQIAIPVDGTIRALDNDGDDKYEVLFIEECESFIVDRKAKINNTIYFTDDALFRGRSAINFDYEDKDKEYEILNFNGEEISFSDINENQVVSVWASKELDKVKVVVNDSVVKGTITTKNEELGVYIDGVLYELYMPIKESFFERYKIGQTGTFALNYKGEIVGIIGEIAREGLYGYVIGFSSPQSLRNPVQIKVAPMGVSEKIIEKDGDDEIINYNYTNGAIQILEFADKITFVNERGVESKISSRDLRASSFDRVVAFYKFDANNKIRHIELFELPTYEAAKIGYEYNFNAEICSYGQNASADPFYVGESTQIICVPIKEVTVDEDFTVDVTVAEDGTYIVVPIKIDNETQIAECAVLISEMDATKVKNLKDTDNICVVGKISHVKNSNDEGFNYMLEVINGEKIENPYLKEGSIMEGIVSGLKKGDLIRYNKKSTGEIGNIELLASLSELDEYYTFGTENEQTYAPVENIVLNRLNGNLNEKVDELEIEKQGVLTKYYIPRKNGPVIYTYERSKGIVRAGTTDEILGRTQVGSGASDVFMIINFNETRVIVNVVD